MWVPLPLMGLPPWMVFCSWSLNLIYQFWVHTERIDRLTSADTCGGGKCNLSPFWPLASWAVLRDAHPSRSVADTDRRGYPRT